MGNFPAWLRAWIIPDPLGNRRLGSLPKELTGHRDG